MAKKVQAPAVKGEPEGKADEQAAKLPEVSKEMQDMAKAVSARIEAAKIDGSITAEEYLKAMDGAFAVARTRMGKAYEQFKDNISDWLDGYYGQFVKQGRTDAKVRKSEAKAIMEGFKANSAKMLEAKSYAQLVATGRNIRGSGANGGNSGTRKPSTKKVETMLKDVEAAMGSVSPTQAAHLIQKASAAILQMPNFELGVLRQIQTLAVSIMQKSEQPAFVNAARNIEGICESFLNPAKPQDPLADAEVQAAQAALAEQQANAAAPALAAVA